MFVIFYSLVGLLFVTLVHSNAVTSTNDLPESSASSNLISPTKDLRRTALRSLRSTASGRSVRHRQTDSYPGVNRKSRDERSTVELLPPISSLTDPFESNRKTEVDESPGAVTSALVTGSMGVKMGSGSTENGTKRFDREVVNPMLLVPGNSEASVNGEFSSQNLLPGATSERLAPTTIKLSLVNVSTTTISKATETQPQYERDNTTNVHAVPRTTIHDSTSDNAVPSGYSVDLPSTIVSSESTEQDPNDVAGDDGNTEAEDSRILNGIQRLCSGKKIVDSDRTYDPTDEETVDDNYLEDYDEDPMIPTEQRLMNKLLRNYERSVRPVRNATEVVLIRMGLTLTQIFDMDEKNQVLVTNVWLDQEWDDLFLTWDPSKYGGLETLRLPCHKIWLPDIVLYNNAAAYTDGLMPANAMITFQGNVFWPVPSKLHSSCKVDVTYFPFDDQQCLLKFGSWTYDGFQVDMINRSTLVDLTNYVPNGEWDLNRVEVRRNVVYYPCCNEPFPDVTFIIHIRRRLIYYLYNVIFPCVMMSALTLLVFCLPPESGEKVTMGITVLLSFSVFLLRLGEDLPETSEFIPLLSIYLTIVMALTSVSVILTVFVLNLHYRGPHSNAVPPWLRRLLGVNRRRIQHGLTFRRRDSPEDSLPFLIDGYIGDVSRHYVQSVPLKITMESLADELKHELDNRHGRDGDPAVSNRKPPREAAPGRGGEPRPAASGPSDRPTSSKLGPFNSINRQVAFSNQEILRALKKVVERYELDDKEGAVVYEWRQMAVAVDRILFWVFLIGTLSSTVVILGIVPMTKDL